MVGGYGALQVLQSLVRLEHLADGSQALHLAAGANVVPCDAAKGRGTVSSVAIDDSQIWEVKRFEFRWHSRQILECLVLLERVGELLGTHGANVISVQAAIELGRVTSSAATEHALHPRSEQGLVA